MKNYEYHHIRKLAEQLELAKIDRKIIDQIMEGGEDVLRKTSPAKKADWLRVAMDKMDSLLDFPTRKAVREGCACRTGKSASKFSQALARDNPTLEARIAAANKIYTGFGGGVWMQDNDEIMVRFAPKGPQRVPLLLPAQSGKIPIGDLLLLLWRARQAPLPALARPEAGSYPARHRPFYRR
jgi:hypothetical protein